MVIHKVLLYLTIPSKHHPWQAQNKLLAQKTLEICLERTVYNGKIANISQATSILS